MFAALPCFAMARTTLMRVNCKREYGVKSSKIQIVPVKTKAQRREFVELAYRLNAGDHAWVPPLKGEVMSLITPGKNPWFEHGTAQLFLARRDERTVGRISAHIDRLALEQPPEQGFGPGTGFWGLFEAEDAEVTALLLQTAEEWLRGQGMTRMLGPVSLAMWDEPGLLIDGFAQAPSVMMGHNCAAYQGWIEALGHATAQDDAVDQFGETLVDRQAVVDQVLRGDVTQRFDPAPACSAPSASPCGTNPAC